MENEPNLSFDEPKKDFENASDEEPIPQPVLRQNYLYRREIQHTWRGPVQKERDLETYGLIVSYTKDAIYILTRDGEGNSKAIKHKALYANPTRSVIGIWLKLLINTQEERWRIIKVVELPQHAPIQTYICDSNSKRNETDKQCFEILVYDLVENSSKHVTSRFLGCINNWDYENQKPLINLSGYKLSNIEYMITINCGKHLEIEMHVVKFHGAIDLLSALPISLSFLAHVEDRVFSKRSASAVYDCQNLLFTQEEIEAIREEKTRRKREETMRAIDRKLPPMERETFVDEFHDELDDALESDDEQSSDAGSSDSES